MIEHIAILKFKSSTSKEQKDLVIHRLKDLVGKLKLYIEMQIGFNFSERNQGFDIGVTAKFEDAEII